MFWRFVIILKLAFQNLLSSKLRTVLTILGIIIGIASVMIVMSVGSSAQALILDQVRNVGSNLVIVLPGASEDMGPPAVAFGIVTTTLKNSDLAAIKIKRNVPNVLSASGYVQGNALIQYEGVNYRTSYQGTESSFLHVENVSVHRGRFFDPEDDTKMSRVAVLGSKRSEDLFGNDDPVGKTIKLGSVYFQIIGVLSERGSVAFGSPDSMVYVPLLTAQNLMLGIDYLNFIRIKTDDEKNIIQTKEDIEKLLRDRHDIVGDKSDDFSIRSADSALGTLQSVTDILKFFLVAVASISLFVGGIGIMNIMLISFRQRIREIGLRKALGALNSDIVFQFVFESVCIACVGATIGVIVGIVCTWIISVVIRELGYAWSFFITFSSVGTAFLISVTIGIVFGVYPARKASFVSPIEALRYE